MLGWFLRILRFCFTVLLLWFLLSKVDLSLCIKYIAESSIGFLVLSYLFEWVSYGVDTLKQSLFLRAKHIKIPFSKLLEFKFLGAFFNNFLPSNIGGDVIRAVGLSRYLSNVADSWVSILLSRFMGILAVFPLVTLSLMIQGDGSINIHPAYPMIIFILLMLLYYLLFLNSRVAKILTRILGTRKNHLLHKIYNLYQAINWFKNDYRVLIFGFILSFAFQIFGIIAIYIISLSLGYDIDFKYFFIIVPIIALITMIPLSINGMGVQDVGFVYFFSAVGISQEKAMAISLLWHFVRISSTLPGGFVWMFMRFRPNAISK